MAGKFVIVFMVNVFVLVYGKKLTQVVMLSRHNIRAPLIDNLEHFSPNAWPVWSYRPAHLTAKGAMLEEYMGEYLKHWLEEENLLSESCPNESEIHIYANTKHRTRESAKAFARGAFRNCDVKVHVIDSEDMDPIFNPVIHNASDAQKTAIIGEMQLKLDALQLQDPYLELENIVELKTAESCTYENICNFANVKDDIFYEVGEEPNIKGPLAQGNSIVDSFLMSYYEGMPSDQVAWGKIKTPEQWKSLAKITKENQNVRFNSTILAKDVAKPLIDYIKNILLKEKPPKFTLLHGHDSNVNSVLAAIGFKGFVLPDQYETTPLGGKVVFQKWHDDDDNKDLLKVHYVYQTTEQLRDGIKLTEENHPQWVQLEIRTCPVDEDGYCDWGNFINYLNLI
ncbi:glucose-1-phosphatase-like [Bicyclus anynana]|uniref:Glucose-1-phosphatase-like n=1 Tax=Bicyclus anynana TaxID=110368 RepID=A0A6J1NBV4_BICAN|nr:glucose-1-phosphatase-like [Bicyclus anynana]